jgi:hypothetical protein
LRQRGLSLSVGRFFKKWLYGGVGAGLAWTDYKVEAGTPGIHISARGTGEPSLMAFIGAERGLFGDFYTFSEVRYGWNRAEIKLEDVSNRVIIEEDMSNLSGYIGIGYRF